MPNLEPRITAGALERELTVRKMERDVEELEHLRKLDEDRAKAEQDRQKALEEERAKAAAAVPGASFAPVSPSWQPQGGAPPVLDDAPKPATGSAPTAGSPTPAAGQPGETGSTGPITGSAPGAGDRRSGTQRNTSRRHKIPQLSLRAPRRVR